MKDCGNNLLFACVAVVWSDVFQVSLMFLAMTAVFIQGFIVSSGAVFSKSAAGGRLNLDK